MAGTFISGISIVYEFTGPENRPTYIGLANTIPGVAGSVAPLIGGWLAGRSELPVDVYSFRHHRSDQPGAAALYGARTPYIGFLITTARPAAFWWVRPTILEINS